MVIVDILMPGKNGIGTCREIVEVADTRVLMLTASNNQSATSESVDAGATGRLQKYSDWEMLLSTVREVAGGGSCARGGCESTALGHGPGYWSNTPQ